MYRSPSEQAHNPEVEMIMATSTYNPSLAASTDVDQSKPGFFARLAQQFVEQRTREARRITAEHMKLYTDEQLVGFGWSAKEIKYLRGGV